MTPKSDAAPAALTVGDTTVDPGTRTRIDLPVARLTTGAWLHLPVEVIHGARPGPTIWMSGAVHGDELDGVEIIRRVLESVRTHALAGTVLAVPVVNVFGVVAETRYLPDRRDLNRSFPGSQRGSMAARLAHLFMKEVVARCSVGLDFHCGSDDRDNLPQVRCDLTDDDTRALALAFGAPVSIHGRPPDGALRKAASKAGARVILYEGGEARRFTESAISTGVAGTLRVLQALGMLPASDADDAPATVEVYRTHWVRAGRSGILRLDVGLGEEVARGRRLGVIADTFGDEGRPVRARTAGIVVGRRINPLVYQGEAVVHVAEPSGQAPEGEAP